MNIASDSPRSANMLFEPVQVGAMTLQNRIVMSPMTRSRAGAGLAPTAMNAQYYAQRAGAGLIITEATQISATAQGYVDTPGIHTDEQLAGWKLVTDAVHARGGRIVVQLWHTGRCSHASFHGGNPPPAPSAIRAEARVFVEGLGYIETSMPRALDLDEIPPIIADFRASSRRAIEAGFDGVELHGAHSYLIDSFLRDGSNQRTDRYGGSIENRARFLIEVAEACAAEIGGDRLGIRLAPVSPANGAFDSNPQPLFEHVVEQLNPLGLAFIDMVEGATGGARDHAPFDYDALRARFDGCWMLNNGYDRDMAINAVQSGKADLVAFGRPFIANPDLVERLRRNAPLADLNMATAYGRTAEGYIDYPALV